MNAQPECMRVFFFFFNFIFWFVSLPLLSLYFSFSFFFFFYSCYFFILFFSDRVIAFDEPGTNNAVFEARYGKLLSFASAEHPFIKTIYKNPFFFFSNKKTQKVKKKKKKKRKKRKRKEIKKSKK